MILAHTTLDHLLTWVAPVPVDPTAAEGARPVLTVYYDDGEEEVELAALVSVEAEVAAIVDRVFTLADEVPEAERAAGRWGAAFYRAATGDDESVRVSRLSGLSLTIASQLTRPGHPDGGGAIWWATWTGTIPARAEPTQARYRIAYTAHIGPGLTAERVEEGVIRWVRQPFATGLTPEVLLDTRPELATQIPDRVEDALPYINGALTELTLEVRAAMQQRGLSEHDIIGQPEGMLEVHMDLTTARIYDLRDSAIAESFRARALGRASEQTGARTGGLLTMVMRRVLLDLEETGELPSTTTDLGVIRPSARSRSTMTEYVAAASTARHSMPPTGFYRGEQH